MTSNVTSHHRGLKQKLRAGYRAPSLQRTSYLYVGLLCYIRSVSQRRVWYRALSLRYESVMRVFDVWASSSPHGLPLCQILFLSWPMLLSYSVEKNLVLNQLINHSVTQSLIQLISGSGN